MINTVSAAVIFLFSDAEYLSWKAMITIKIKFAAVVTAFAVLACMQSVSAETAENITVLGDSISTGYGLDDDELSYCGYLQEYFDCLLYTSDAADEL